MRYLLAGDLPASEGREISERRLLRKRCIERSSAGLVRWADMRAQRGSSTDMRWMASAETRKSQRLIRLLRRSKINACDKLTHTWLRSMPAPAYSLCEPRRGLPRRFIAGDAENDFGSFLLFRFAARSHGPASSISSRAASSSSSGVIPTRRELLPAQQSEREKRLERGLPIAVRTSS